MCFFHIQVYNKNIYIYLYIYMYLFMIEHHADLNLLFWLHLLNKTNRNGFFHTIVTNYRMLS